MQMKLSACHMSLLADKETARGDIKVIDVCAGLSPFYICTWEFLFQQLSQAGSTSAPGPTYMLF